MADRAGGGCLWRVFVAGLLAVCVGLAAHFWWWSTRAELLPAGAEPVVVRLDPGTSWPQVSAQLVDLGVIDHPLYWEVWGRRHGLPGRVKAGTYALRGPLTVAKLAQQLGLGGPAGVVLTVPEGWTMYHVAQRVEALGICPAADFLREATDPVLLDELGLKATSSVPSVEGYLFPETYYFEPNTACSVVIKRMVREFERRWAMLETTHRAALAAHKLDRHQLVTLASLVERESAVADERPLIARVFMNRLDKKMRLQTDPTCVYGPTTFRDKPSPATCKDKENRYSTYVIDGLPPGPIANPGMGALEAALLPDASEAAKRYLFFVATRDGSGRHVFTETFEAHKEAVDKHLR
jgi:UPF0755 protein